MDKRVYVYNMVKLCDNDLLLEKALPSTIDFYVHKSLIQNGYMESIWVDEQEYFFRSLPESISAYTGDYSTMEEYLRGIGYTIEEIDYTSSILV